MWAVITGWIDAFNVYATTNQFVAGVLSLWGLGILSYLCRDTPKKIYNTINKFSTTTVTLTSYNEIFYSFLKWYEGKGFAKKGRYLKLTNGRYGEGKLIKSVGYGRHYFWYKKRLIIMDMLKKDASNTTSDKDEIVMTTIGRSHYIFNVIFEEVLNFNIKSKNFIIKKFSKGGWIYSSEQRPRPESTVFLDSISKSFRQI